MAKYQYKNKEQEELGSTLIHLASCLNTPIVISDKEFRLFHGKRSIGFRLVDVKKPIASRKVKKDMNSDSYYFEVLPDERKLYEDIRSIAKKALNIN